VRLRILGAAKEVGRSALLLEAEGKRILLDAGVGVGAEYKYPLVTPEIVNSLDAVVITHAHIDHSAYLPRLFEMGFSGNVYITKPTRDLFQVLVADYRRIAAERNAWTPSTEAVTEALRHMAFLDYGESARIGDVRITFKDAGHILGSAQVIVEAEEKRLIYSGDINPRPSRLHSGADLEGIDADILITESTYGHPEDRLPSYKTAGKQLADSVRATIESGGFAVIPSFAIGRAQEVILTLDAYMRSGAIPDVPIVVDGMIKKALRIYRANVLHLREEIWKGILLNDYDPFRSERIVVPRRLDRSDILELRPTVIVSTSGMLTGGPVLRYLEMLAYDERSKIILTGYQAPGTPGRRLLEGARVIRIGEKSYDIRIGVEFVHMSAHADYNDLIRYADAVKPERAITVHGEPDRVDALAKALEKRGISAEAGELDVWIDLGA